MILNSINTTIFLNATNSSRQFTATLMSYVIVSAICQFHHETLLNYGIVNIQLIITAFLIVLFAFFITFKYYKLKDPEFTIFNFSCHSYLL